MNVIIRADASIHIGLGHLARCRTLAVVLREQGVKVRFISRALPGHQIATLRAEGFRVAVLPAPPDQSVIDGDYAAWLGVTQAQDAQETIAALTDQRPDWLIVDHYALDSEWEQTLRPHVGRILIIDDLANRRHDADLLLDQNYAPGSATRYQGLLPPDTRTLLGPTYALLRPEYAHYRQTLRPRDGNVRRVLVFFGGTDPQNISGRVLTALSDPALAHLEVDLVIGANHPQREDLTTRATARPFTRVHGPRPHLADLMATADLAIGAGGTTTWERCCLGLPSLVVSIADNQRPTCIALAADGLFHYVGHHDRMTSWTLLTAILQLLSNPVSLRALSKAGADLVDAGGTKRIIWNMNELMHGQAGMQEQVP